MRRQIRLLATRADPVRRVRRSRLSLLKVVVIFIYNTAILVMMMMMVMVIVMMIIVMMIRVLFGWIIIHFRWRWPMIQRWLEAFSTIVARYQISLTTQWALASFRTCRRRSDRIRHRREWNSLIRWRWLLITATASAPMILFATTTTSICFSLDSVRVTLVITTIQRVHVVFSIGSRHGTATAGRNV